MTVIWRSYLQEYGNLTKSKVFPTFLTGLRYHTVTHRDHDRDLTSVQRPEMININSFGIVTELSRDGHGHGHVHGRSRCGNGAQSKKLEIL